MSYHTADFLLLLLPLTIGFHFITPQKHRWKILLIASYIFFWSISGKLIIYLLLSTFAIHYAGLWLNTIATDGKLKMQDAEKEDRKAIKAEIKRKQRYVLALMVFMHIGLLLCLKYLHFFGTNANNLLTLIGLPDFFPAKKFALPIGISFYTLQAVSYIVDVYRGKISSDKNLGRLALFMSFFPVIMEGPICRYSDTAVKLFEGNRIVYANLIRGMQRIIFGLFKKIVIADRLNLLVKTVFDNYQNYNGGVIFVAMLCYTCQLYMDFSGTMEIVIGVGEIFGVKIPENFRQPFFSKNISEFWTRWHITLGTWFRDYVYYPLSLTKPLKKLTSSARKKVGSYYGPLVSGTIALGVVWLCNGLWHGSAWSYIFFGFYHFLMISMGNITLPAVRKVTEKLHINRDSCPYIVMQIIKTFILVNIGELFFRANGLRAGLAMFKTMVTDFSFGVFTDSSLLKLGLDGKDFIIVIIGIAIVFAVSVMREKGISPGAKLAEKNIAIRWTVYYAAILSIIVFGAYGIGYAPVDPMYAGF